MRAAPKGTDHQDEEDEGVVTKAEAGTDQTRPD